MRAAVIFPVSCGRFVFMSQFDKKDKKILNRIQSNFPVTSQPFLAIAEDLGLTEAAVIESIIRLKDAGIIRRIGGNIVPGKIGFVSTLCAASVPEDKIDDFARLVNQFPGVTHNYQRDDAFNIWFTFIAPSMTDIEENLKVISRKTGITEILNLPATKVYKIKAQFDI
jgi:DNA-binding Lrp family transcriptional regulator